mmetsp:Transcript_56088/g.130610  ORF Transcript_56088/g.130610 Transcript_56088/m.130610 type:complete len:84 (+) Transcript_56088:72-323(+)
MGHGVSHVSSPVQEERPGEPLHVPAFVSLPPNSLSLGGFFGGAYTRPEISLSDRASSYGFTRAAWPGSELGVGHQALAEPVES